MATNRLDEAVERDVQALDELAHRISGDLHLAKLGASGWPINRDCHARRCRARLVERQPGRHPAGGKEASTGSDDDGKDKQIQAIDQVMLEQEPHELPAAMDLELAALALLQIANGVGHVALDHP